MSKAADKIKLARKKANLTEKQLAKKCGLTANYIEQVESGKKIISETIAEKIFKVLKIKEDSLTQESLVREETRVIKRPKPLQKTTHKSVDHSASWSGALDNLIRKYPIYNIKTQKIVGEKKIPTVEKKINGYNCDKLSFIEVDDNDLAELGIVKSDILTLYLTTDITNDKIYYYEMKNKKYVSKLRKEQNNKILLISAANKSEQVDAKSVKIIGKCVKLERNI